MRFQGREASPQDLIGRRVSIDLRCTAKSYLLTKEHSRLGNRSPHGRSDTSEILCDGSRVRPGSRLLSCTHLRSFSGVTSHELCEICCQSFKLARTVNTLGLANLGKGPKLTSSFAPGVAFCFSMYLSSCPAP